jgi:hypothetical protein
MGWNAAGPLPYACPMVQHCARCKRRMVVSYHVPQEIKRLVLLGRWRTGVCASCFDELAEQGGIHYSFEDVSAMSWSDMPVPRTRPRRGR